MKSAKEICAVLRGQSRTLEDSFNEYSFSRRRFVGVRNSRVLHEIECLREAMVKVKAAIPCRTPKPAARKAVTR